MGPTGDRSTFFVPWTPLAVQPSLMDRFSGYCCQLHQTEYSYVSLFQGTKRKPVSSFSLRTQKGGMVGGIREGFLLHMCVEPVKPPPIDLI